MSTCNLWIKESVGLVFPAYQKSQAAWATAFSFALALAHAAGVNGLISVILSAGIRRRRSGCGAQENQERPCFDSLPDLLIRAYLFWL